MLKASLRAAVRPSAHRLSRFLSSAYVAGPLLDDALRSVDRFKRTGSAATIGYFNDDHDSPQKIADLNVKALELLAQNGRNGYVSVKSPAMGSEHGLIIDLAKVANRTGVGIHFDSHAHDQADSTLSCVEIARRETSLVGCTLPGRWARSLRDADRAVELGVTIRVVKGQWPDPAAPEVDLSAHFLALIDRLAGRARLVRVATHDPLLASAALRRLQSAGTECELELLFGLPMRTSLAIAREYGVPTRIYVPFGNGWMPYAMSQLRRNPGIAWWMMKDAFTVAAQLARS